MRFLPFFLALKTSLSLSLLVSLPLPCIQFSHHTNRVNLRTPSRSISLRFLRICLVRRRRWKEEAREMTLVVLTHLCIRSVLSWSISYFSADSTHLKVCCICFVFGDQKYDSLEVDEKDIIFSL
ncbi:MAG: hypothetical protein BYD32DRAFT_76920 [Podila humilis]|nr:MAG: hypothetical protein BYD32DRAFT_76920 [Podila humilis]